jgi:hypothetical protein
MGWEVSNLSGTDQEHSVFPGNTARLPGGKVGSGENPLVMILSDNCCQDWLMALPATSPQAFNSPIAT